MSPALRATLDTNHSAVRYWQAKLGGTGRVLAVEVTRAHYNAQFVMPQAVRI